MASDRVAAERGDHPVANVSWDDAVSFCHALTAQYGAEIGSSSFRLPTQAQWEFACKSTCARAVDDRVDADAIMSAAWCAENSGGEAHEVGLKLPNDQGIHDMLGNVSEWCFDAPASLPLRQAGDWEGGNSGNIRTVKGGNFQAPAEDGSFLAGERGEIPRETRGPWLGFRVAMIRR